ncbi:MAG: protease complex subunit PrcB family protein [Lachnospiraceae bacterium]
MGKRAILMIFLMILLTLGMCGCGKKEPEVKKLRDLNFTVVDQGKLPKELEKAIGKKKKREFKLTYTTDEFLYIAVGYGVQKSGGYSIKVNDLYVTENAIYFDTELLGPAQGETVEDVETFPYIVVKLELMDKSVIFQ